MGEERQGNGDRADPTCGESRPIRVHGLDVTALCTVTTRSTNLSICLCWGITSGMGSQFDHELRSIFQFREAATTHTHPVTRRTRLSCL
jgi:hypothetical protein